MHLPSAEKEWQHPEGSAAPMVPSLLLPCGCGAAIMLAVQITSWLQWAACGCCIVLVYCISMYLWGLNSDEKEQVYSVLRRVKRKGREM